MSPLAQSLYDKAFGPGVIRDPRSPEYQAGVLAAIRFRVDGGRIGNPFPVASAQSDAFYAGTDEGHRRWREHQDGCASGERFTGE
jgi:hypothetical protein